MADDEEPIGWPSLSGDNNSMAEPSAPEDGIHVAEAAAGEAMATEKAEAKAEAKPKAKAKAKGKAKAKAALVKEGGDETNV
jgi:hypothetical protein